MPKARAARLGQVWLVAWVTLASAWGCAYPDYSYVDDTGASGGAGGTGGTGAAAGVGATGGSGGASGSSGQGATGGSAGEGATGGTAGAGGSAGEATGGTAGEGGIAGSSGSGGVEVDAGDAGDADVADDADAADAQDVSLDVVEEADAPLDVSVDVVPDTTSECVPVAENCTNGVDDDCDGLVDCADPDCTALGFTCLSVPPTGWQGYYAVYDGSSGSGVPSCTVSYPVGGDVLHSNLQGVPAQCSNCSCGTPTGTGCADERIWFGPSTDCSGSGWVLTLNNSDVCSKVEMPTDDGGAPITQNSIEYRPPVADPEVPGSCEASQVNVSKTEPSWETTSINCRSQAAGGGCGNSLIACVAKPGTQFTRGLCVYREGVHVTCPSPYVNRYVYYAGYTDTRTCSSCSCGVPDGVQCGGSVEVDDSPGCGSPEVELSQVACSDAVVWNPTMYFRKHTNPPSGGSCAPSGGEPMGEVVPDPATAHTFCCWLPN